MPTRQLILIVAIAGAFGVLVPYYKGYGFLDRRLIVAYACLAAVFAGPTATDAFAPDEQDNPLRKMARVWLSCWGFAALLLALALLTVNLTNRHARPLIPRTSFLIAAECLGLTASAAITALGAFLTRQFSAARATSIFRTSFLIIIIAFFLLDRYTTFSLGYNALTRWLYIVSAVFGAAALVFAARYPEN
ncbi:MAG: hypothetical protein ABSH09_27855 [Bryobacteraceae bacterium]|jgi:hypothetical protein